MWTTENRGRYDRSRLRYPSDLTDDAVDLLEMAANLADRHSAGVHRDDLRVEVGKSPLVLGDELRAGMAEKALS